MLFRIRCDFRRHPEYKRLTSSDYPELHGCYWTVVRGEHPCVTDKAGAPIFNEQDLEDAILRCSEVGVDFKHIATLEIV